MFYENLKRHTKSYARRLVPAKLREQRNIRIIKNQEPLLQKIIPLIEKDKCAIDIGAHQGTYTSVFKSFASSVVAFEPIPENIAILRTKFNKSIEIHECALGESQGQVTIYIPHVDSKDITTRASVVEDANIGFEQTEVRVDMYSLDHFNIENVGIVKIDTEGNELEVIKGGINTIRKWRPLLVIEIEERHHPGESWNIINFVERLGYKAEFFKDQALHPINEFDFDKMQNIENLKHPCGPTKGEYINNFVFMPESV